MKQKWKNNLYFFGDIIKINKIIGINIFKFSLKILIVNINMN